MHVVSDGVTEESLRELLSEGVEFGPRGVGSDLRQYRRPDGSVVNVRADGRVRAQIDQMMASKGLELVPYMVNGEVVRSDSIEDIRARALGQALYEDGALEERCFQPGKISDGLQQFIDTHPGVRARKGPGPFLVALMPDGSAVELDHDGTVIADDGEPSNSAFSAFVDGTDWDAISDSLGPDEDD